ncbi:hypothetical protein GCM10009557_49370 [Virgisporangium ochraceum]
MPAMAICTDLRWKPSMVWPGIWNEVTTSRTACIAWSGTKSVLVGGHAGQQLVADRVAADVAGVAVGDPGRQLLEADVADAAEHALVVGGEAAFHVGHAGALQGHRVDGAGGEQIVTDGDAVAALLRGPAVDPRAPGTVAAEADRDLVVVAGQVVLGEEVHDQ